MTDAAAPLRASPEVTLRKPAWSFPRSIGRDWYGGSAALTAMMDTFTLVIPDNERYYIRTLARDVRRLPDERMRRQLRAFLQQEALHGDAHRAYWTHLRDEGIDVERVTGVIGTVLYKVLEPILPHRVHVANVAAIEHVNAYLAHLFLTGDLLANADPAMRRLFEWHFAEEIEHKSVAFDALASTHPGYFTRAVSAVLVFSLFHALLAGGTIWLLVRRRALLRRRTAADFWRFWIRRGMLGSSLRWMRRYLRPSFHPWEVDDYAFAGKVLRGMAAEAGRVHAVTDARDRATDAGG